MTIGPGEATQRTGSDLELRVLEAIANGQPLPDVLALIVRGLEHLVEGWRVSVLLVEPDGLTLRHGAAPSLPDAYVRAVDGLPAGPVAGSCGTAVHRRTTVIVEDIATDPLWAPYRHLALPHGLRACWSVPLMDRHGAVVATFAVYQDHPARPNPAHLALIERFVHLARVALHHDRAQRELRASEERFRSVFRDAAFGIAVADRSGRLTETNLAYQRMLGYTEEELQARTVADLTHPDDRDANLALIADLTAGRRDSFVMEKRYLRKDGRTLWARVTVSARRDADGRVTDTIALAEDVSRQHADEQVRAQQQRQLQMASRIGRLGAWYVDVGTQQPHLADETLAIYEFEPGSTPDNAALLTAYDPEHLPRILAAARLCETEGVPFDEEGRLRTAKGNERWVRVIGEAVRDAHGTIVRMQGALQDITDRKQLQQQSLRSQRLQSIGTLAGGIAHDLNNVLTPIAMGVGLLKAGERDASRLQLLAMIEGSATRAANMVQQVLSFARGIEGSRAPVAPADLVRDVAGLLADTLPKQIRLEIDTAADAWPVSVDATQIHQVLLNLCLNARDAMPDGGMLRIGVHNAADTLAGRYVRLSVEDTGEGIPSSVLDQIFDPFFTTKPTGSGTGLGLSTSLGIVRSHGGRIDVESRVGAGSRFDVLLPAAADAATRPAEGDARSDPAAAGYGTVLLVDDERAVRLVTRHVLQASGYRVVEAADGDEALRLFEAHAGEVRLVVSDMMMPGMDGAALVRALRARAPHLPIVGMSGLGAERGASSEHAVDAFLAKPFTPDRLREALHHAFAAHAPR